MKSTYVALRTSPSTGVRFTAELDYWTRRALRSDSTPHDEKMRIFERLRREGKATNIMRIPMGPSS